MTISTTIASWHLLMPPDKLFATARNEYDTLVQQMVQVWIVFLGASIVLWFYLRWTFTRLKKSWLLTLSEAEEQWDRDLWAPDQQGERQTKRRFFELTKESYDELFCPLEPFVAVFIVFGIPACVMATDYCQDRSQVSATGASYVSGNVAAITVGKCDVTGLRAHSFLSITCNCCRVLLHAREPQRDLSLPHDVAAFAGARQGLVSVERAPPLEGCSLSRPLAGRGADDSKIRR
jgi:hypothetical protein